MTNYVKAKMSFYHDKVGTRAMNEVFQVQDSQALSELERAGYVAKVDLKSFKKNKNAKTLVNVS